MELFWGLEPGRVIYGWHLISGINCWDPVYELHGMWQGLSLRLMVRLVNRWLEHLSFIVSAAWSTIGAEFT